MMKFVPADHLGNSYTSRGTNLELPGAADNREESDYAFVFIFGLLSITLAILLHM